MDLSETLSKSIPNAGPQARASIAEAERRLAILAESEPKRAAALRQQAIKQIESRDDGIRFTLADIGRLHGASLGRAEPQEKEQPAEEEVARSIQQLVSIADSRNIAIPPAMLNDAARASAAGDKRSLAALGKSIGSLLDVGIEVQQREQKKPVQLNDGSVMLVGEQSGTRYDNTGSPIPFGAKNEQLFATAATQAYGGPVQALPDVGAKPEAYAATPKMKEPEMDVRARDEQIAREAYDLYKQGRRKDALFKLRSLKARDYMGGDITDATLDAYMQDAEAQGSVEAAEQQPAPAPSGSSLTPERMEEIRKSMGGR